MLHIENKKLFKLMFSTDRLSSCVLLNISTNESVKLSLLSLFLFVLPIIFEPIILELKDELILLVCVVVCSKSLVFLLWQQAELRL